MTTPLTALWTPVTAVGDLDVRLRDGRVQLVDRRYWLELVELTPRDLDVLGYVMVEKVRRAGWARR